MARFTIESLLVKIEDALKLTSSPLCRLRSLRQNRFMPALTAANASRPLQASVSSISQPGGKALRTRGVVREKANRIRAAISSASS